LASSFFLRHQKGALTTFQPHKIDKLGLSLFYCEYVPITRGVKV
jgi:hypothetical protein